jgi:hypothetical protein
LSSAVKLLTRALSACLFALALAVPSTAQTVPPWNPGALPTSANWNAYFSQKQDLLPAGGPGVFGPDGSPQGGFGYAAGATQFPLLTGSQTSGGFVVCHEITYLLNVDCGIVAQYGGAVRFFNGWGDLAEFTNAAGNQQSFPYFVFTSGNSFTPTDISDANGNPPTLGHNTAITTANTMPLFPLNCNGDFIFSNVNFTTASTQTFGQVNDCWRVLASQSGKLSFVWGGTNITGYQYALTVTAAAGSYAPLAADQFILDTNLMGGEVGPLQFGNANAQSLQKQICIQGWGPLTYPFVAALAETNLGAGGTWRSYVATYTLADSGAVCHHLTIPGDTSSGLWADTSFPSTVGLSDELDLGSGTNFQCSAAFTWVSQQCSTVAGASSLVSQPAGAGLVVTGVHLSAGPQFNPPYAPLPYLMELQRASYHFFSDFPPRTKPANGLAVGTGEQVFPAAVAGVGTTTYSIKLGPTIPNQGGNASTKLWSLSTATTGHCWDSAGSGTDAGLASVVSYPAAGNELVVSCAGGSGVQVGDPLHLHVTVDAGT